MGLFEDLFEAVRQVGRVTLGPFRAWSETSAEAPSIGRIRNDPVFGGVVRAIEDVADASIEALSRDEIREIARTEPRVQAAIREAEREALQRTDDMPVTYREWISIAFDVAKAKGADFSATQGEIRDGDAPAAQAIEVFAEIWSRRKAEISQSRAAARRVAEAEITVSA